MKLNTKAPTRFALSMSIAASLALTSPLAFAADEKTEKKDATPVTEPAKKTEPQKPEAKSEESKAATSEAQSEVEKNAAEKRAKLLKDAQAALDESNKALKALDEGKKDEALAALAEVTAKLDSVVVRDPNLALAPVTG